MHILSAAIYIDKSHNAKHCCIMAGLNILITVIHEKYGGYQNSQGLSYKVCSTDITKVFRNWIIYSSF